MKIAVDAMGGDNAPQAIIAGVEQARDQYSDLEFQLYGDPAKAGPEATDNHKPVDGLRWKPVAIGFGVVVLGCIIGIFTVACRGRGF